MLFERINASGVGLSIGSIGPSAAHSYVRNITFRNCTMYNSFKGIYLKSRPGDEGHTDEN
jgi:polygalacturonase